MDEFIANVFVSLGYLTIAIGVLAGVMLLDSILEHILSDKE